MLNLADNLLEHIDQAAFEPLKHLKALRLDNNRIHDLNGLLTTYSCLEMFLSTKIFRIFIRQDIKLTFRLSTAISDS